MSTVANPRCPRCGSPLLEFTHQGIRIDECGGCEGVWLDSGELRLLAHHSERLLWSPELGEKWKLAQTWAEETSTEEKARSRERHADRCPRCDVTLHPENLHGTQIDRCTQCGGTWLDKGELSQLAGTEPGLLDRLVKRLLG